MMRTQVAPVAWFGIGWSPEVRNFPTCLSGRYWLSWRYTSAYRRGSKTYLTPCKFPVGIQRPAVCQDGQHCDTPRTVDSGQLINRTFVLGLFFFKTFVPTKLAGACMNLPRHGCGESDRSGQTHSAGQDRRSYQRPLSPSRMFRRARCPGRADTCPGLWSPCRNLISQDGERRTATTVMNGNW